MAVVDSPSLLIAPLLQGAYFCEGADLVPGITTDEHAAQYSAERGLTGAPRIEAALSKIGPATSPSGRYELGYTLGVPLLRYFVKRDGEWVVDRATLRNGLRTICEVDRKVVVYLSANHFTDAGAELSMELARDPVNLMWTRSGPMFPDSYFNHPVIAWTMSNDEAGITKVRREAFRAAIEEIGRLPEEAKARIAAVSLLGEVHQMFPDFMGGPSYGIPLLEATDFSPSSLHGFQLWLQQRFGSVKALSKHLGRKVEGFDGLMANPEDVLGGGATGNIPIYGWLHAEDGFTKVSVHVDGDLVGYADSGLSRTDVVDALPMVDDPNIGFRFNLDFSRLKPGQHSLDVVAEVDGRRFSIAKRVLTVLGDRSLVARALAKVLRPEQPRHVDAPPAGSDLGVRYHLDGPVDELVVKYDPLACLWQEYRNSVTRSYIEGFAQIAIDGGIPREKIFGHQISLDLVGHWDPDLVAVEDALAPSELMRPGVTLYGGTAFGDAFVKMKRRRGWGRYGVSEMHPATKLSPEGYRSMFEMHRLNGAAYVAPYYLVVTPASGVSGEGLSRFLISEMNPNQKTGSAAFYEAIKRLMNE